MEFNKTGIIEKLTNGTFNFNDEKLRAAFALNLCTVSVSQIIDYNDVVVLEQEYDAILNNLNIERMPKDESLLCILKQLMDTITFFMIQEGDKRFIDREYQNKMKNAIWSAVPNIAVIFSGGDPVTMAVSLATQVGIGYMNYRKAKAENTFAYEKQQWELHKAAIEQFNGLRRELFDTAWRLVDAHDMPDEYRLTERQLKQYNEILMDSDYVRKYERLDTIKENFVAYPPFWYFFGNTANMIASQTDGETAEFYKEAAKIYYDIFVASFSSCNLLRESQVASACALEYIDLLDASKQNEKIKMEELLSFAVKMSGNAKDVLQLCAFAYMRLGDGENAATIFRRLVNEDYNTVVNAQLLSAYYVRRYLEGNASAKIGYSFLKDRINEEYLYPLPVAALTDSSGQESMQSTQQLFIANQKTILARKYKLALDAFEEKSRISFYKCVPVPEGKKYTDAYFDNSNTSYEARKSDGVVLKNRSDLMRYVDELTECDYPYNYLNVLNDMINAAIVLNCVQGRENSLLTAVSEAVITNRKKLLELRAKIEDPSKFTPDTYTELLDVSFHSFTAEFFILISEYSGEYVEQKDDILSMNEAEMNLREFCLQQGIATPDELYISAGDISDEKPIKRRFLGMELIEDGVTTAVLDDRYNEVKSKIEAVESTLCVNEDEVQLIFSDDEKFDRYFIRLGVPNKRDIRRKTVAILDDCSDSDNDLLFTTEGVMQILKGRMKEAVAYDDIMLNADKTAIILHREYQNENVDMAKLIDVVLSLRSIPFAEVAENNNPLDFIAGIAKNFKLPF